MANGRPWTQDHTATMESMAGRSPADIAQQTGHSVATVKKRMQDAGIHSFGSRSHWTRRDWLLADAAGLDFQISNCPT